MWAVSSELSLYAGNDPGTVYHGTSLLKGVNIFDRSRCNFPHSGAFDHVFRFKMISLFHCFSSEPAAMVCWCSTQRTATANFASLGRRGPARLGYVLIVLIKFNKVTI